MSQQPKPYEALNVFNPVNYPGDAGSDKLNFSVAQGTETFPNGIILGDGTYLNSATGGGGSVVTNPLAGNLNAGGFTVTNLATPSSSTDAVTLAYFQSNSLTNPLSADLDAGGNQIFDMADPTTAGGAVNLQYLTGQLANYLTTASAASIYETITNAASTYLTIANAAATYETIANAASTYLTISNAASTYAPLASPALTGTPTAPTAATSTNTTQIATTAYVQSNISSISSPFVPFMFNYSITSTGNYVGGPKLVFPTSMDPLAQVMMRISVTLNGNPLSSGGNTYYNDASYLCGILLINPGRIPQGSPTVNWSGLSASSSVPLLFYLKGSGGDNSALTSPYTYFSSNQTTSPYAVFGRDITNRRSSNSTYDADNFLTFYGNNTEIEFTCQNMYGSGSGLSFSYQIAVEILSVNDSWSGNITYSATGSGDNDVMPVV